MLKKFVFAILLFVAACGGQTKEDMVAEGNRLSSEGNYRGAIVFYKNALEQDSNYNDARVALADAYLNAGRFDRAEKEFQKLYLQNPADENIFFKLVRVYIQRGLTDKALLELDNYVGSHEENAKVFLLYGLANAAAGDLESGQSFMKKALALDPASIEIKMNLARIDLATNQFQKAYELASEVIDSDKKHVAAYYLAANAKLKMGEQGAAMQLYQDLLAVDPAQMQALLFSGVYQLEKNNFSSASNYAEQLKAKFPKRGEGSRLAGMILYRQQKYDEANLELQQSLGLQKNVVTYFFLGLSQYANNELELALNQFQNALDINPSFERARIMVALVLFKQQRFDDAFQAVSIVLNNNPDNAIALNVKGNILLAQKRYDEGMEALDRATDINPGLVDAYLKKGVAHFAKGEKELGETELVSAVDAAPELVKNRIVLVTYYLKQKNYSEAVKVIKDGFNGDSEDALLYNYLAAAYFAQKKFDDAIIALNKAKEVKPDYLTPYFNLAQYYASMGEYVKAIHEYQGILENQKNNIRALLGMASVYGIEGNDLALEDVFEKIVQTQTAQGYVVAISYYLKKADIAKVRSLVEEGLREYPDTVDLLTVQGRLLLLDKDVTATEKIYRRIYELNPEQGSALLLRLYLASGEADKAKQFVSSVLSSNSLEDYSYLLASSFSLNKKDINGAIDVLQKGISKVKKPFRLQVRLGNLLQSRGDVTQAEQLYSNVFSSAPKYAAAYMSMGTLKEQAGDKGAARDYYKETIKRDKLNIGALNNLAYLLADNFGEYNEAIKYAMDAYRFAPGDPRIMDTLAFVLLQIGKANDAEKLLVKAHELMPDQLTIMLHLAQAKAAIGKNNEALDLVNVIIEKGTGDDLNAAKQLKKSL